MSYLFIFYLFIRSFFYFSRVNLEDEYYPCKDEVKVQTIDCSKKPLFDISREWCIYIFAAITFGMIVVTLVRSFAFVKMCMNISMNLHNSMFNGITRATMYFFNTNPSGMFDCTVFD